VDLDKIFIKKFVNKETTTPFTMKFWDGEEVKIGDGSSKFKVNLYEPLNKKDFLNSASLALGEAYMNKSIDIEGDLYLALDTLLSNIKASPTNNKALPKIFSKSTSKLKQKNDVSSHYDIGNDFYSLWLDDTLSYSCAYFKNENDTLYDAQMNKIHHTLKKLNLKEGESLLDIGCGWGTLLIEAAKKYKVKGLGITLSDEQYKKFSERIVEENLQDYLEVRLMDYRDLEKSGLTFDKVVSVGMLEHVGRTNYDLYFKNINAVLKKGGIFVLHYISGMKETEGDAWIKKYIFPGGMIPSLREIINISVENNYCTVDVESLRLHYTKTLLEWYKNFEDNIDEISTKFDEKFIRMWRMYLCSCAAAFNNNITDLHQIVFTKGANNNHPLTREYLYR
jgi:cyclopropane-fatty-acyl-phospholipid synthase